MLKENKKKTVAVLRGGKEDYHRSMKNGANIILSLSQHPEDVKAVDVSIDSEGNWFEKGVPSDPHKVFSNVDYYIDLVKDYTADHHKLAKKLNVKQILENDFNKILSRINIRRILDQLGFNTPKYVVFRDTKNLENNLKLLWSKMHTPLIVKDGNSNSNSKSILTYSFLETYKKIKDILSKGGEAIVEEYLDGSYVSLVAIPNYRGEDLYTSIPVETVHTLESSRIVQGKVLKNKYLIEHDHHKRSMIHIDITLKKKLKEILKDIHTSLSIEHHVLLDLCIKKKGDKYDIKIIELHTNPNLFDDSRFDFILRNSGIDMGRFIIDRIEKIEESELIY